MKNWTAKELIESAVNLSDLKEIAPKAIRMANPMNGEREDVICMMLTIAHGFGRASNQTIHEAAAEFRAKHPDVLSRDEENEWHDDWESHEFGAKG